MVIYMDNINTFSSNKESMEKMKGTYKNFYTNLMHSLDTEKARSKIGTSFL